MTKGRRRASRIAKGSGRGLPKGKRSLPRRFFGLFVSRPMRYFLLLVLFLALLFYFVSPLFSPLISELETARDSAIETFGLGLVLLAVLILLLIWMAWRWQVPHFLNSWNRWLGGIAFFFAIFGFLAFFKPGGDSIIAEHTWGGDLGKAVIGTPMPLVL